MFARALTLTLLLAVAARADYECLCNYHVELRVFSKPDISSSASGQLYEFDCKPTTASASGAATPGWASIAYEHSIGYVQTDAQVSVQTCPGDFPTGDIVTEAVTTPRVTTESTTTTPDVTEPTTPMTTTTASKTRMPTTTAPTTPMPTTTTTTPTTPMPTTPTTPMPTMTAPATPMPTTTTTTPTTPIPTTTAPTTPMPTTTAPTTPMPTTTTTTPTTPMPTTTAPTTPIPTTTAPTTPMPTTTTTAPTTPMPTTAAPTPMPTTTAPTTPMPTTTTTAPTTPMPTTAVPTTPMPTTANIVSGHIELCPTSWQTAASKTGSVLGQYGSSCYELVNHRYHWRHAESYCHGQGGHLFHMSSRDEEKYILSFLQQHHFNHSVWTGLHDLNAEEHFEWTSGDPLTYTNWVPGRQSNFVNHHLEDCVVLVPYLYGGDWDDIQCGQTIIGTFETQEHYFICQIGGIVTGVATSSPQILQPDDISKCSHNLVQHAQQYHYALGQHGTSCYELIKHSYTWDQAEQYCVRHAGHLVHIYSADEQAYVLNFLRTHSHADHAVWIGLNDEYTEERFHWTTGAQVSYTNWLPGRQSNFANHHQEDCVVIIPQKNGLWDDIPCGSVGGFLFSASRTPHYDFICQYGVSSSQPIGGGLIGK